MPNSVPDTLQEEVKIQCFFEISLGLQVFARITIAALAINYTFILFLIFISNLDNLSFLKGYSQDLKPFPDPVSKGDGAQL